MVANMTLHGADVIMEPTDVFWGERFSRARNPFEHEWGIEARLRDMTRAEITAQAEKLFDGSGNKVSPKLDAPRRRRCFPQEAAKSCQLFTTLHCVQR